MFKQLCKQHYVFRQPVFTWKTYNYASADGNPQIFNIFLTEYLRTAASALVKNFLKKQLLTTSVRPLLWIFRKHEDVFSIFRQRGDILQPLKSSYHVYRSDCGCISLQEISTSIKSIMVNIRLVIAPW